MTGLNIGARIREHRMTLDMSQEELAETCLCSRQTISNWETNKTLPDVQSLKYLAAAFDTTVDNLIADDGPEIIRRTSADRRELKVLSVANAFLLVLALALRPVMRRGDMAVPDIPGLIVGVVLLAGLAAIVLRMTALYRKHHLSTNIEIADYLAGRISNGQAGKREVGSPLRQFYERNRFAITVLGWALLALAVGVVITLVKGA